MKIHPAALAAARRRAALQARLSRPSVLREILRAPPAAPAAPAPSPVVRRTVVRWAGGTPPADPRAAPEPPGTPPPAPRDTPPK
jgi:hypothetical protein